MKPVSAGPASRLRRPQPQHPSLSTLAFWLLGAFVVYGAETVGWGKELGLLVVAVAAVVAYAWSRFRPRPHNAGEALG